VFCHTPDTVRAPDTCRLMQRAVAAHAQIPPLPWDALGPEVAEQGRLL
jgi:hypothetical protein